MSKLDVLAGIIGSDGHLDKSQPVIKIINKDIEFLGTSVIPLVKEITGKEVKAKSSKSGFGHERFIINICSIWLWKVLQERHKIPIGSKSDKIISPNLTLKEEQLDFLRGWFAGDGSVTHDRKRPRLEIWSKSKEILEWFQKILIEVNIESTICFAKNKNEFLLTIRKKESIKKFHEMIKIPHPKKERKLISFLN